MKSLINKMSITLSVSGQESSFTTEYFPPIDLSDDYECGLIYFKTFNSIPNVDYRNNKFHFDNDILEIPTGTYEIDDIGEYLSKTIIAKKKEESLKKNEFPRAEPILFIRANNNTLKCEVKSSYTIDFTKENSIGATLGFTKRILQPNKTYESDLPVNILTAHTLRIECSIIEGSYLNGESAHTLYEFSPTVPPGYQIIEVPKNIIYLPLKNKSIKSLTIQILDSEGQAVNFRKEYIIIRLHLKKII